MVAGVEHLNTKTKCQVKDTCLENFVINVKDNLKTTTRLVVKKKENGF